MTMEDRQCLLVGANHFGHRQMKCRYKNASASTLEIPELCAAAQPHSHDPISPISPVHAPWPYIHLHFETPCFGRLPLLAEPIILQCSHAAAHCLFTQCNIVMSCLWPILTHQTLKT